ncbi:MAG TPA: ATP-binding protein [Thermoanaerobaculia bacterium]|nr:ATP-binding protein [Thermoanaerobaculia bacterium]
MSLALPRPRRARTRIALAGAFLSALFLVVIAFAMRTIVRSMTFADIDDELYTLSVALGSSFELEGLLESKRDTLRAGLEANAFEFRLANHSAILFDGDTPIAASGNLLKGGTLPGGILPFRDRQEVPYTAVEPYSGQGRWCRFLVTRLQGKARGSTLVLFRWIGPSLRNLARLDRALALFVLTGFLGTAAILTFAVGRAIRPVEVITRQTQEMEATDLSGRVPVSGGEEFQRLAAVINSLLDRVEAAFRAQRRLVADAAHELKTPIAVLVGEVQEAGRPEASEPERRDSIDTIGRVARGLASEVDNLLHLARGDAAPPPRPVPCDLSAIAEETVASHHLLAARRGVRFHLERDGPAQFSGDRAGVARAVSNLVTNAILYTAPDTSIDVLVGRRPGEVFLEVRDRGPGVPPERRAEIFERFVRLGDARERNPEGSGLGLAIVDQVVKSHGGRVQVGDHEGGGAVFCLTLPSAEQPPATQFPA